MHKFQTGMAKPGVALLLLELFNYRLLPLYRYDRVFLVDDLIVPTIRACLFSCICELLSRNRMSCLLTLLMTVSFVGNCLFQIVGQSFCNIIYLIDVAGFIIS